MKILLGVQGTGNGHLSRCSALVEALERYQVDVDVLISGRAPEQLFDVDSFGDYRCMSGLTFATSRGKIDVSATLKSNAWQQFWRDYHRLDLTPYDLIVSDFEPITAWAARKQRRRCIGIGRQYAFCSALPQAEVRATQRWFIQQFAPATDVLGMHWVEADGVLPPIIHQRGRRLPALPQQVLVYLPFESLDDIRHWLAPLTDYQFSIFHPQAKRGQAGHLQFFAPSRVGFAEQFSQSSAVISNAGFETTSEALSQGKKLLVKPLHGQFEQRVNASLLEAYGLGSFHHQLSDVKIRQWLSHARSSQLHWPNVAEAVADWLASGAQRPATELARTLWQQSRIRRVA